MATNGVSLGIKSAIQVPRNAASDPLSEMGHSWLKRDTVVGTRPQMQSNWELCYTTCQMPLCVTIFLLFNWRVYDTCALMAAVVRTVAMAKTTWSSPTPVDLSILSKDAVCHVCGKGHFAKDCWHQSGGVGKERKARKAKGKAQNPRVVTPRRKVFAINVASSVANLQRRRWCTLLDVHR